MPRSPRGSSHTTRRRRESLLTLIIAFQKAGFFSVLPLFTSDNRVLLVVAVTTLPGNATLLTAVRRIPSAGT